MKKYIFKTVLCSVLAVSLTTSCELDQYPESSIPVEKSWEKVSDAENFYVGLLAYLRSVSGGATYYVSDCQSDLFNAVRGAASQNQVHEWVFTTSQFGGDAVWVNNYSLITNANNILDNIDNIKAANDEEQAILNNIKGSAYFSRAYGFSNMVSRYCVNYDEATAGTALGLPLTLKVDVNAKPARASLQATFDQILTDIAAAETLLGDNTGIDAPNLNTLKALKARVYFKMNRYDEAIKEATALFDAYPLTAAEDYPYMWINDNSTETIYQPTMTPDERSGSMSTIFIAYNPATETNNPYYIPTQGLIDLYEDDDIRKAMFFTETVLSTATGDAKADGYMFYKFPGNPDLYQAGENETNAWYNMHKPFRIAEMYLIAAESSLMKANRDEKAALEYLNALRTSRGASALASIGSNLTKDMKDEWTREFVGEGFRLDCLKRWNDPVVRMTPQALDGQNMLINAPASSYTKLNIQTNDPLYAKIIWEVPAQDLQSNSNLVGNW